MRKTFFISGIGTEVGKTVVSAAMVQALKADYWKPIQSGDLHNTDSMKVKHWIANERTTFHPESFRLETPASPHLSARLDGVKIDLKEVKLPATDNNLIIEGAGGLLVPISEEKLIVDLIEKLKVPVILVVRNYLGSINHTLLSIEALWARKIELLGLVYSGAPNRESEKIINTFSGVKTLGVLPEMSSISKETIANAAKHLSDFDL